MKIKIKIKNIFLIGIFITSIASADSWVRGIYITQPTLENTKSIKSLISQAKQYEINTFVIDFQKMSNSYRKNISLVEGSNIKYVARIVVFTDGGTRAQVTSEDYWAKKYQLVDQAVGLGASEIQLDYIRYNTAVAPSSQNAHDIYKVIRWFKDKLSERNIPLQIDVFGITAFRQEYRIGQYLKLFADAVDVMCPMVYPSHYEPYLKHAKDPYGTVASSLQALHDQFKGYHPFKIYPFIELYNYRYPLSQQAKLTYIYHELKAVDEGSVQGWYAWSPNNKYSNLFEVLRSHKDLQ